MLQGSTMYVISSPELSEAELLSVDNPSEHDEWENAASSSNDGELWIDSQLQKGVQ